MQGDGTLQGWTIQNEFHNAEYTPLHKMPGNFFAVAATPKGGKQQAFVLATPASYTEENCNKHFREESHVTNHQVERLKTLPGIRGLTAECKYPIAEVDYDIPGLPVNVTMETMTPLIPQDSKASSMPLAQFSFTVTNPSQTTAVDVRLMQSTQNFVGWDGKSDCTVPASTKFWGGNVNTPFSSTDCGGLFMTSNNVPGNAYNAGNLAISALKSGDAVIGVIPGATDEESMFNKFEANAVEAPEKASPTAASAPGLSWCGAAVQSVTVAPGGSETVTFVLSWYFPNRPSYSPRANLPATLGNNYNNWFTDAVDVCKQFSADQVALCGTTRKYRDTMYATTIPWSFLETAAGRLACMRSPTMFWTAKGWVLGNEGNNCCPLNCTHVYGYTTLLERCYPDLAKDMRVSDFVRNYNADQGCTMRFGSGGFAIDGSLANVIKTYLVVQQSDSDGKWLPTVWPNVKAQMELVFKNFDTQGDGMFRCEQQNTYDTAMQGPNTFIGSYWVVALKSTAAMAMMMGEPDFAKQCSDRASLSAANYEKTCWNDKFGYYIADVTAATSAHSYGPGCFIDQLCAIGLSTATGFGTMFNPAHEAQARKSILKYNKMTKPPFQDLQKHFYDGDSGITVCSYPNGKLGNGMQYTTLVSIGFTYPVVAGMIYDRNVADANTIATYIRQRHSGINRSPWNEPECGLLYSRAMAGWNLFDQCCGLTYDSTKGHLGFDPRTNATNFSSFVLLQDGWGEYKQVGPAGLASGTVSLEAQHGTMVLSTLQVSSSATKVTATVAGKSVAATISNGGLITFAGKVLLNTSDTLTVTLGNTVPVDVGIVVCPPGAGPACCPGLRQRKTGGGELDEMAVYRTKLASIDSDSPTTTVAVANTFFKLKMVMFGLVLFLMGLACGKVIEHFQSLSK